MSGKRRNKDNDIVVSFLGTSKQQVTGSMVTISYPKNDGSKGLVVLECGLCQGEPTIEKSYSTNKRMLEGIGKEVVQSAEYVLLGHAHV